jgi:acyl-CoA synthetase (AMP-forming)/AMP-acid ligase II
VIESASSACTEPAETLADLVRRLARQSPGAVALAYDGRETTYCELDNLSNRVAQALIAAGIRSGSRVAILDKNTDVFFPDRIWRIEGGRRAGADKRAAGSARDRLCNK